MRVAVLADIHGNLAATEAVLDDIKSQAPDYIVAAGDLALRGAHPAEVFDLLASSCHSLLMGNTDAYLAGIYLSGAYRERDHWKTELLHWTRQQLGPERLERFARLDFSARYSPRRGQDLYVCHANPKNLEESLEPTLDEQTIRRVLGHLDAAAVAFGHLHFPYRRRVGRMLIADVASTGIPRDGDLRPAWGLFTWTPRGWRLQIRRVRYALRKATQALTDRKVPGAPLLIHKMIEAKYRHHHHLAEAARRHSGLPPYLKPPPGSNLPVRTGLLSRTPPLPPPPGFVPPPGQSTQLDEAADELIPTTGLVTTAPEETEASDGFQLGQSADVASDSYLIPEEARTGDSRDSQASEDSIPDSE
jgi:predicted phosphodiesterase